jgi:hypothetical protein
MILVCTMSHLIGEILCYFLDRCGSVRAADRRDHPARQDEAYGRGGAGPDHARLSPCADGSHACQMAHDRCDAGGIGSFDIWTALRSSAVFPGIRPAGTACRLKLSEASSIYATDRTVAAFEKLLKDDPDIDHWTSNVGQGAVRFYLPLDVQLANDFFAQSVILTKSLEARERLRSRLEPILIDEFPGVASRLSALELGPPVGWPLQYRVSGPEPARVRDIAYKLSSLVAGDPRTEKISFGWIEPQRKLRMRVDQDQARLLGVSSQVLAQSLSAVVSGINVTQLRDGLYLINVVARERAGKNISRCIADPASSNSKWGHRSAASAGNSRIYSGLATDLAAGSKPNADCPERSDSWGTACNIGR